MIDPFTTFELPLLTCYDNVTGSMVTTLDAINAKALAINSTFTNGKVDVVSPDIESLSLCTGLPLFARVYIGPWLLLYPLAAYAFYIEYDRYIKSIGAAYSFFERRKVADVVRPLRAEWSFLLCICLFGGHALSFLSTRWSVGFRSRGEARHVTFSQTRTLQLLSK